MPFNHGIDAAAGACYIAAAYIAPTYIISPGDIFAMHFRQATAWSVAGTLGLTMLLSLLACALRVLCLERCCEVNAWTLWMLSFAPRPESKVKGRGAGHK